MDAPATFTDLADGPCADADELLLSLAAEFWPVDAPATRARLDDESRRLFGAQALALADRAHRVGTVLEHELGIVADQGKDPELLRLDRVLDRRRGHPLVVAALGAELLRRAGIAAAVCSSPTRWFVGIRDPHQHRAAGRAAVRPRRPDARAASGATAPTRSRSASSPASPSGSSRANRRSPARLALALRLVLPVDEAIRIALQRDLDAFGPA